MVDSLVARPMDNGLMLYDSETDVVHVLNITAGIIYESYRQGLDLRCIRQRLCEKYVIAEHADIDADIRSSIDEMQKYGLL
jgi:hypothetical protein